MRVRTLSLFLFIGSFWMLNLAQATETALDRYVARPDSHYSFSEYRSQREFGYNAYFLKMTSQQWRSAAEVDRPIWEHCTRFSASSGS